MDKLTDDEVAKIDKLLQEHLMEHQRVSLLSKCDINCRRLTLRAAINTVLGRRLR